MPPRRLTFDGAFSKVRTLVATQEASSELIDLVRELCRRAARPVDDTEIRGALARASAGDEAALRKLARSEPPARPLGPLAWMDVARGVDPAVAAARELGGYYALLAERDALAAMLQGRDPEGPPAVRREPAGAKAQATPGAGPTPPEPRDAAEPRDRVERTRPPIERPRGAKRNSDHGAAASGRKRRQQPEQPAPAPEPMPRAQQEARGQHLLGLFAYHRDAPLVARALGIGMTELERELDLLKLRRKAFRLVRGIDSDLPAATAIAGAPSGPPVRRRAKSVISAEPPAKPEQVETAPVLLKAALKAIGARRDALATRLGVPLPDLLARFRDAGLERDFAAAERDLIRELYARHRGSQREVAKDLGASESELRGLIAERSLAREIDGLRERYRREARQDSRWPRDRIEQVLRERAYLEDLGIWEELHREVVVRASLLWKDVRKKPDGLELLQKALRITQADARELRRLLNLR